MPTYAADLPLRPRHPVTCRQPGCETQSVANDWYCLHHLQQLHAAPHP